MSSRSRRALLAGAVATAFAAPLGAATTTYELYGEQGPAAFQVTNDMRSDMPAGKMQAKSQTGGVKGEFSAFETVPRDAAGAKGMERTWSTDPAAVYPDSLRITP